MTSSTLSPPSSPPADLDRPGSGNPKQHYLFLDGLRGVVSVYVAAYHFLAWMPSALPRWITHLQKPLSFGHVSVSVFIVLSGFSLMLPVAQSPEKQIRGGMKAYFKRRSWRILPAYYAAVALAIVVALFRIWTGDGSARFALSPACLTTHLLLIHNLFIDYTVQLNDAHWSVAAEWQIYFLMPFVLVPLWRWRGTTVMVLAGFALATVPLLLLPPKHNLAWTCPWYIGLFAVGMAAATIDVSSVRLRGRFGLLLAVYVLIGVYFAVVGFADSPGTSRPSINFAKDSIAGCAVGALILYCMASRIESDRRPVLVSFLGSRLLVAFGGVSYSLYLTHMSVLELMLSAGRKYHWTELSAIAFRAFIGLPLAIGLAFIFARFFERPFMARRKPS